MAKFDSLEDLTKILESEEELDNMIHSMKEYRRHFWESAQQLKIANNSIVLTGNSTVDTFFEAIKRGTQFYIDDLENTCYEFDKILKG